MIKNGKGGGNTKTGLIFEGKTDLATFLNSQSGYRVTDGVVFYNDEKVARIFKKHGFYRYLKEIGVEWERLFPRNCSLMAVFTLSSTIHFYHRMQVSTG